jgi:hypothetical protein
VTADNMDQRTDSTPSLQRQSPARLQSSARPTPTAASLGPHRAAILWLHWRLHLAGAGAATRAPRADTATLWRPGDPAPLPHGGRAVIQAAHDVIRQLRLGAQAATEAAGAAHDGQPQRVVQVLLGRRLQGQHQSHSPPGQSVPIRLRGLPAVNSVGMPGTMKQSSAASAQHLSASCAGTTQGASQWHAGVSKSWNGKRLT